MNTPLTVASLVGQAWALAADGTRRELQVGDRLRGDETLIVAPGAQVDLDFGDSRVISFVGEQTASVASAVELAAAPTQHNLQMIKPLLAADNQDTNERPVVLMQEGHRFVQLVRISEIVESDGLTPLTVARIQEVLNPLEMAYPDFSEDPREWREHRGGDEPGGYGPDGELAARYPGVHVELQGAGEDGIYSADEIGPDGTVTAWVTLNNQTREGDVLVVRDGNGNVLLERVVTAADLLDGILVKVPVAPGQAGVTVHAVVTTPDGSSSEDSASRPVENVPPVMIDSEGRSDADSDKIDLDVSQYFAGNTPLTYTVKDLPPGLSFDPLTGKITGTLDSSASQGGADNDGRYVVTLTATDKAGNSSSQELVWTVTNPPPVANDDVQSITEDSVGGAGNVLTGLGADNGSSAADKDPDGDILHVIGVAAGALGHAPIGQLGVAIEGKYGSLTINADGSYTYLLDNDNPLVKGMKDGDFLRDVFTYTISDGEGGQDTATLTLIVNGRTDGDPAVTVADLNGTDTGSNSIAENATGPVTGTFTVTAPDGLNAISVGGTVISAAELTGLGSTPVVIPGSEGTLTLIGFNPLTGEVTYSYQQSGTHKDHSAGDDSVTDSFAITVTDNGGATSAPSNLVILITDTAPQANPDVNSVTEDAGVPATGNVMSGNGADDLGADATTVTGVTIGTVTTEVVGNVGSNIAGKYGTLILGSDGNYTYTLDDTNVDVNGLKNGQTLTETFSYTIKDADGDFSTTTLTITINGNTDGDPAVSVADLNGTDVGSNSIAENATAPVTGTFTVTAPDGLGAINVGGTVVTAAELANLGSIPVAIPGGEGTLTLTGFNPITGEVTYNYLPSGTGKDHSAGPDSVTDSFAITVTDNGGATSAPSNLVILITDTAPQANPDVNSVTEDAGIPATGNVMNGTGADDLGGDATTVTGVTTGTVTTEVTGSVGSVVTGQYGTLVLGSDGHYTYTLDDTNVDVNALKNGQTLTDTFSYTIKDADGDFSTTTLTITINGNTDGDPAVSVADLNGTDVGSNSIAENATAPVTGTFTVTAPDGLSGISVGGTALTPAELASLGTTPVVISGSEGTLTLTGFNPLTGEVTYSYQQSGTHKDHSAGDDSVTDSFAITVTDNGGATSAPSNLVILITDTAPQANPDVNSVTEDAGVPATGNVMSGNGADDLGADATTVTGVTTGTVTTEVVGNVGSSIAGQYGTLILGSDGNYTYTLDDTNVDVNGLKNGQTLTETFSYTIKDADGDFSTTTLTITINGNTDGDPAVGVDDLNGTSNSIAENATDPVTGTFTVTAPDGLNAINVGGTVVTAAQLAGLGSTPVLISGGEGTLTLTDFNPLTGEVTYSYQQTGTNKDHQAGKDSVTDSFAITVTDKGGATSAPSNLVILITDTAPKANPDVNSVTEDAGVPATGNVMSGNGADDLGADATTVTGVTTGTVTTEVVGNVGSSIAGQYGTLVLGSDGNYTYTLDDANVDVNALKNGETLTETFSYTIKDADGDFSTTTLTITINGNTDGDPVVGVDDLNGTSNSIAENATDPVTGTFTVTAPDGLNAINVGGTVVTAAELANLGSTPVVIPGSEGTLTLTGFDPLTGEVTYSYQQSGTNKDHSAGADSIKDSFAIVVTDNGGTKSAPSNLVILITDTAPQANPDVNSVTEDAGIPATGNVMTGSGADDLGGDATTVTGVTTGTVTTEVTGSVGSVVTGQYGTLVLGSDGHYTYTLDDTNVDVNALKNGQILTDTFSYTIKDADGDFSTTTLTITINGNTDGDPAVSVADLNGTDVGSNSIAENATAPVTGTFTVTAPDGLSGISVGGTAVTAAELASLGGTPVVISGSEGTLTLTGFNPLTGEVTYSYQQTGTNKDHRAGKDSVTDSFAITVTDKGGATSAPSNLVILITDTAPKANPDVNSVTEDAGVPATGNVMSGNGADDLGADTTTVTGVVTGTVTTEVIGNVGSNIAGKYGTLLLGSDGNYTYTLDDTNVDVNGLKNGQTLTETFSYTIKDADGDFSTTTLTITINGNTDGDPAVSVADLNGTDVGSNSIAENATTPVTGTFTVTAPDGLGAINVGGTAVTAAQLASLGGTPVVISGSEGTLTLTGFNPLTGEVTYSYQQTGTNKDHQAGKDSVTDSFAITVTDNGGATSAPGNLVILITDTAPKANPDVNSVTEDEGIPATGNVMSGTGADDLGGDTTTVTGVTTGTVTTEVTGGVGSVVTGQYGTLVLRSDGNYTYTLDDNNVTVNALKDGERLTETFSYTIKDADGDFSTTTLTITINGNTDGIPSIEPLDGREEGGSGPEAAGHVTVYESGLTTDGPAGKEKTADGSIKLTAPDGLSTVTVGDGSNAITLSLAQLNNLGSAPRQISTDYGTLTLTGFTVVKSVGGVPTEATLQYSYTLDRPYDNEAPTEDKNALDLISLIVQDIGGEKAAGKLEVNIIDDAPSVGTVENKTVSEAGLPGGSQQGDATAPTSVSAGLAVRVGADNTVGGGRADVRFLDDQTALANLGLSSGHDSSGSPVALQYVVSPDGHTITAYRGEGRAAGDQVFNVVINNPDNNAASYTFTLTGALNHGNLSELDLPFAFGVTDGDNDRDNGTFIVTVTDDTPTPVKNILINEDSSATTAANTFNTSADANSSNTIVRGINGGPALEAVTNSDGSVTYNYPAGTSDGDKSFFGSITVNVNGSITFVPAPNYSNAGGADKFQYETVSGSDINTVEVTVNVTPVSDAPELGRDAASVITDEDVAVALGFKAPVVTDGQDQNGSANGDFPELLGVITLSGIPAGAVLLDGSNGDAMLFASTGEPITIVISDGQHVSGITGNTLTLTTAQFEALKVLPAAHAHENFIVEMTVTSYEVDQNGNALPDVPGAPSSITVEVDVLAVTDPVSLTFDDLTRDHDLTIDEDGTFDLSTLLTVSYPNNDGNTTGDLDGSEERWFEISGLPIGSKVTTANGVIEVTAQNPVVTVPAPGLSTSATGLPQMVITPPPDYSGPSIPVTVTLKAQDHDSDSSEAKPAIEQDSVTLNLQVDPVADRPVVVGVTTPEDTPVAFLQHVAPGDTDGSEELLAITVKGIPDGWVLQDHNGTTLVPVAGQVVISAADVASGAYKGYTLQPPAHSSLDATLQLDIQVRDNGYQGNSNPDTQTFTNIDLKVKVTPVAEKVNTDTDNSGTDDLTLTPGHDYTTPGAEDTWFNLGQETGFDLADGWYNEDSSSEKTFALLTPTLVAGDGSQSDAMGSSFRYSTDGGNTWIEQIFGGDPIEVPVEYLSTLQFKAAPNFSGAFSINVQALTRDYDEDDLAGRTVDQLTPAELAALSYNEAISGSAELLNILILPVADAATATVTAHVRGNEDEAMAFSIRPSSSDKSETFEVTVSSIPDGAKLMYGGIALTADATGLPAGFTIVHGTDGTWSVEIVGFDPALGSAMTITAPRDSNVPFTLKVATVSVDVLNIPGDPGSPYIDKSSPYELNILVSPKGVADPAILTIIDPADQSFEEATLDANGGVFLRELVTDAKLTDTDGSESLSFKISNLPPGFSLVGGTLIGVGIWSLTEAQLKTAKLITPPNFNGTATFNLYAVTTENDGDSLTQLHEVSLRVEPSPEATINLSATIDEDVSTALSFAIQHKNGDIDEKLDAVWLSVSDVDGALDFGLTYGVNGVSLAQAALDGMEGIKLEGGWYKLTGAALDNIYAQGRVNWSGSASFGVRYFITDPAADGTVQDKQIAVDDTYGIKVNPITDQPTLAVTDGKTTTLDDPGSVTVQLNIGNVGRDYDGSEHLNRIIFANVPDGVIVNGAEYLGNGQWMLVSNAVFTSELNPTVTLSVQSRAGGLIDHQIKVTVITEDSNNGQQLTATTDISLTTTFTDGESTPPAEILQWEQTSFEPTEDQAFSLRDGIAAEIESGVTDNGFTVSLTNLPPGTTVTGMRLTLIDGREVWTASGTGGNDELQTLLESITVTPPADWNKHFGDFVYDANLTTYIPSGDRSEAVVTVRQTVNPVTDDADIAITAPTVSEGNDLSINIDISNGSDDPNWTLIDGILYVTLDEPAGMQGGVLKDNTGAPLTLSTVTGVSGVPDGSYYVIDVSGGGNRVDLLYTPKDEHVSGSINLSVIARGQELDSSVIKATTATQTATITPVNSGYDFSVTSVSGKENAFAQAAADKSNVIALSVTDNGLVDNDGSEVVGTILLKGLPKGFLVYVGDSADDAVLASLGSNAGDNGDGINTWMLGTGTLPKYIGILPPAHWSGTVSDLQLVINSQETSLSEVLATTRDFTLTVDPVADGVQLTPTPSFGKEGDVIQLNLNAEMSDLGAASPTDDSVETINLQFKGLGEHAGFYIDGVLISGGQNVTYADGVYTLRGLTQDDVGKLGFVQGASAIGDVQVRAQTVESGNGDTSAWSHEVGADWGKVAVSMTRQYGTTGDDKLLWTGEMINGRGGDDVVQLRFGEGLSGTALSSALRNIEAIDMTGSGANSITSLSAKDVFDMTDARNTLRIDGDAGGVDRLGLDDGSGWTLNAGAGVAGYDVYTATIASHHVTLEVASGIHIE